LCLSPTLPVAVVVVDVVVVVPVHGIPSIKHCLYVNLYPQYIHENGKKFIGLLCSNAFFIIFVFVFVDDDDDDDDDDRFGRFAHRGAISSTQPLYTAKPNNKKHNNANIEYIPVGIVINRTTLIPE